MFHPMLLSYKAYGWDKEVRYKMLKNENSVDGI
jgi:hypothetical protein